MQRINIWEDFDGPSGTSGGWHRLSALVKPTLHVWGVLSADSIDVYVTMEDNPTVDDFTNAIQLGPTLTGVDAYRVLPEDQQGWIAIDLVTNSGAALRQAVLTGDSRG